MSRTMADIQVEYQRAAIELGGEIYKIHALDMEIQESELKSNKLKDKMEHLNKEANKLAAAQAVAEPVVEVVNEAKSS